jgi:hypothetical protein
MDEKPLGGVTRLLPRTGPLEQARLLFGAARYDECLTLLSTVEGLAALALRLRTLARLGRRAEAVELFEAVPDDTVEAATAAERARFFAIAARAFDFESNPVRAKALVNRAQEEARQTTDPELLAEVDLFAALVLGSRDLDERIDVLLEPAASSTSVPVRAQALEWLSIRASQRGDAARHQMLVEEAWTTISADPASDMYMAANVLYNTAIVASDVYDRRVLMELPHRMLFIQWCDALADKRCLLLHLASLAKSFEGDYLQVLALNRLALTEAKARGRQLQMQAHRLLFQADAGMPINNRDIARLRRAIRDTDWSGAPTDASYAVLSLVELDAARHPLDAERDLEWYMTFNNRYAPNQQFALDPLGEAYVTYCGGLVSVGRGRLVEARIQLNRSFEQLSARGHRWRAALCVLRLLEIGAATEAQIHYLVATSTVFPRWWAAVRARELLGEKSFSNAPQEAASP